MRKGIFVTALCLALTCCGDGYKTAIPEDFEIVIEGDQTGLQIKLMAGVFTERIDGEVYTVKFSLTPREKLAIYNVLSTHGLLKLQEDFKPEPRCHSMLQYFYDIKISTDRSTRRLGISNCDYNLLDEIRVNKYLGGIDQIVHLIRDRPEVKNLPKSTEIIL